MPFVKYTGRHRKLYVKKDTPLQARKYGAIRKRIYRRKKHVRLGYKGVPNSYSFCRETRPTIIDLGTAGSGVTLLAGTGAIPNISVFEFPNFSIDQLAGGFSEFSNLFANYKITFIQTVLVPQWQQTNQVPVTPLTGAWAGTAYTPNLMITRINTKYLTEGLALAGTAEDQRDNLAQLQKKTRSLYGSKKWLKINTKNPKVTVQIPDGAGGHNVAPMKTPWLGTVASADQEYVMNDVMFADTLNGSNLVPGVYQYRMYHKIWFQCAFVG